MYLHPETIDEVFTAHEHQTGVIIGLHKLIYDGSAEDRPLWDLIEKLDDYPIMGIDLCHYIWDKFVAFDKIHHPEAYAGGLWMNRGWATDISMEEWAVEPAPAALKEEL